MAEEGSAEQAARQVDRVMPRRRTVTGFAVGVTLALLVAAGAWALAAR